MIIFNQFYTLPNTLYDHYLALYYHFLNMYDHSFKKNHWSDNYCLVMYSKSFKCYLIDFAAKTWSPKSHSMAVIMMMPCYQCCQQQFRQTAAQAPPKPQRKGLKKPNFRSAHWNYIDRNWVSKPRRQLFARGSRVKSSPIPQFSRGVGNTAEQCLSLFP